MRPGSPAPRSRTPQPSPAGLTAAMAGAVDLAAVKARSEAQARAAQAPAPEAAGAVVAVTEASFQAEVLDRSFQVPVLIDLWAAWCQPCKQLSPVLERLAAESGGAWVLATIDVDANPRISQALQVQSIPTVYAVIGGQLAPGFQGALPEAQIREFITAVLQAASQAGLPGVANGAQPEDGAGEPAGAGEAGEPVDPRFAAAEQALEEGDFDLATQRYQAILAVEPGNEQARVALLQTAFLRRLASLPADALQQAVARPNDVEAVLAGADAALAANRVDDAFTGLLGAFRRFSGPERDAVRARLVEYFELLGPDDPRVGPARRSLAAALF